MKLKISLIVILLLSLVSAVTAISPVEVNSVSPWTIDALPCRTLTYQFDIINNEKVARQYHLSLPEYSGFVDFSMNDFEVLGGKSKRVAMYITLPCSVNGEIIFNMNIKLIGYENVFNAIFKANIKSDYSREISVAPVNVCKGEIGEGSLHILNPSKTPNLFMLSVDIPDWMNLYGNKVLLLPNSQADFNFSINPNADLGEHLVSFVVKDFSGIEEIPFTINVKDCENKFELLDHKILAVKGMEESFKVPYSGFKDSMTFALQAPEWVNMEQNLSGNYLTFNINVDDEVEAGNYDVIVLAKNGVTVSDKLVVSVTDSKVVKVLRTYIYQGLGLILLISLIGASFYVYRNKKDIFNISKEKVKDEVIEIKQKVKKVTSFDDFDFANFELKDNVKIFKDFKVNVEPKFKPWMWLIIFGILLLSSIVYAIWRYCGLMWAWWIRNTNFLVPYKIGAWKWWIQQTNFLVPVRHFLVTNWYILIGLLFVILLFFVMYKYHNKEFMKKVYDFFFEEPESEVEEKVFEIKVKEKSKK